MSVRPVDVAIVNYNTVAQLRGCLTSLRSVGSVGQILVADNGSTDGSLPMVHAEFPEVRTVSLAHNPGFGAAVNELASLSTSDALLVLNADVRVDADTDSVALLAKHLDEHAGTAVVGPSILGFAGEVERSWYPDPTVGELLWQESGLHRLRRATARDPFLRFDGRSSRPVPWLLGAALLVRRRAFDEVGGFDPDFFLYYEEVDLCRRVRQSGWTIDFVHDAHIWHQGGASTSQRPVASQRTLYRSLSRFHRKHATATPVALGAAVAAIMLARIGRDGLLWLVGGSRHDRSVRVAAIRMWWAVLGDACRGWTDVEATANVVAQRRSK